MSKLGFIEFTALWFGEILISFKVVGVQSSNRGTCIASTLFMTDQYFRNNVYLYYRHLSIVFTTSRRCFAMQVILKII